MDRLHVAFNIWEKFHVMVDIPFAKAHTKIESVVRRIKIKTSNTNTVRTFAQNFKDIISQILGDKNIQCKVSL